MRKPALLFAPEVDLRIEALSADDYRMHRGVAKRLLEEVLPISRLGAYLKEPGLAVEVETFEDDGPIDGRVWISGYRERTLDVHATCTFNYIESLRAELLCEKGFSPGAGSIARDRISGQILAEMAAVDIDEHFSRVAGEIMQAFRRKEGKESGLSQVLIIAFDEIKIGHGRAWRRLYEAITESGGLQSKTFDAIYLFNGASAEIQLAT